jgi:hypothetical protein
MTQYALFETAIGFAGVAWTAAGLTACHLPERDRVVEVGVCCIDANGEIEDELSTLVHPRRK